MPGIRIIRAICDIEKEKLSSSHPQALDDQKNRTLPRHYFQRKTSVEDELSDAFKSSRVENERKFRVDKPSNPDAFAIFTFFSSQIPITFHFPHIIFLLQLLSRCYTSCLHLNLPKPPISWLP